MKSIFAIFLIFLLLCSCRTQREIVVEKAETVRTDTVHIERVRFDSIFVADKTEVYSRNDTVFVERLRYVYRDRAKTDTLWRTRTEFVTKTLTETKTEEVNRLTWWQTALCWIGGAGLIAILAFIAYITGRKR